MDILPTSPDALADIAHVVWIGKTEPDISKIRAQFTVRKQKVINALRWLRDHHEDYCNVTIDNAELDKWPSVFITECLLKSIGRVRSGAAEDASRDGFATEDLDTEEFQGDIPNTVSGILDVNNTTHQRHLHILRNLEALSANITINVVAGNEILQQYNDSTYFTSAFPTLFPWGTGKHLDERRKGEAKLTLKKWTQLLLRNSSR